jgi:hypothetical protein
MVAAMEMFLYSDGSLWSPVPDMTRYASFSASMKGLGRMAMFVVSLVISSGDDFQLCVTTLFWRIERF